MKFCRGLPRFSLVTGLLALLLASCTSEPALNLTSSSAASVQAGESFTVTLQAEHVSNLMAAEAHLSFDPAVLEVVALQPGDFLQTDFIVQNVFDNAAGTIDYAVAQIGQPAAQGSGALLVIEFRARAAGDSLIRFRATPAASLGALLADSDGSAIPVALGELTVRVVP